MSRLSTVSTLSTRDLADYGDWARDAAARYNAATHVNLLPAYNAATDVPPPTTPTGECACPACTAVAQDLAWWAGERPTSPLAPTLVNAAARPVRARGTLAKLPDRTTYDLACWDAVDADDLPAFSVSLMPTDDDGAAR